MSAQVMPRPDTGTPAQRGRPPRGLSPGSAARGRETTWGPVDGGSARDLRAAAITANPARQLTGLCATAHRPTRSRAVSSRDFFREEEKTEKKSPTGACARALAHESGVGRAPWSTRFPAARCPSPVAGRSRALRNLAAAVDRLGGGDTVPILSRITTSSSDVPAPLHSRSARDEPATATSSTAETGRNPSRDRDRSPYRDRSPTP
jgi:hypothetical protein